MVFLLPHLGLRGCKGHLEPWLVIKKNPIKLIKNEKKEIKVFIS